jgi:hypothetical protein
MSRRLACWNTCFDPAGLLLLALLASSTGCYCAAISPPGGYLPYTSAATDLGCDHCGGDCDGSCGAGVAADYGVPCQQFPSTCGTLAPGGCGGLSGLMLPLLSTRLACGSGCGNVYWGEWLFDPPECCDACNDDGCWAGYAGSAPYEGYRGGCLQGILAGPAAVIRGTYLGVTGVLNGACCMWGYGYNQAIGYGDPCGCAECTGAVPSAACSDCGATSCTGDCVQTSSPPRRAIAGRALGTGVQRGRSVSPVVHHRPVAKPPHPVVTKRLRR